MTATSELVVAAEAAETPTRARQPTTLARWYARPSLDAYDTYTDASSAFVDSTFRRATPCKMGMNA